MTDNGPCFHSLAFRAACRQLGLKHVRTRPYKGVLYAAAKAGDRAVVLEAKFCAIGKLATFQFNDKNDA